MVIEVNKEGRLGSGDHEILLCTLEMNVKTAEGVKKKRDWKKANYPQLRNEMNVEWEQVLDGKNVDDTWLEIKGRIHRAMDNHVPWRRTVGRERPR